MSPLEQLIMKKMQEGKQMSPLEQKAKMSNLDSLKNEMQEMMKGHLDGDKDMGAAKVEIASDSPEGLREGLDKAQDVLGDESSEDEMSEMPSEHEEEAPMSDASDLSAEEMQQLKMLLAKMQAKQA